MANPMVTATEAASIMRSAGIRTSATRIVDGIESGAYPFGRIVSVGPNGRRVTEIFRKDFYEFLREKGIEV